MFIRSTLNNSALSALGAVAISAACIFGVAGPAKAASGPTEWQRKVESRFDAQLKSVAGSPVLADHDARVLVKLDGNGRVASARLTRSSGMARLDEETLRAARAVRYPTLTGDYAGRPMTVELQAYFGTEVASTEKRADKARQAAAEVNDDFARRAQGLRLAAK